MSDAGSAARAGGASTSGGVRDARPPPLSLVFGYGPALVQLALGVAPWFAPAAAAADLAAAGRLWGVAILIFLAGVRRGLSFLTEGGPRPIQIAMMLWLFVLGLAGLLLPFAPGCAALLAGFGSVAILDPRAARRGEVPAHFAALRPPQMALFAAGIASLLIWGVGQAP